MVAKILADASPQRRLFISLITRDISLADAMLDLIDNSINAALVPLADQLKTADDYQKLQANNRLKPKVEINLRIGSARIVVEDNAPGIPLAVAQSSVFKFGRDEEDDDQSDRLSVYGIGLKRAIFKCGNRFTITSDHKSGGFELKLPDISLWAAEKSEHWTFPITARAPVRANFGTRIIITELRDDVLRRINDGLFLVQLRERIARTYSVYIGKVVEISLNNQRIDREPLDMGGNITSQKFGADGVTCNITAGIAMATDSFKERNAGWYVYCNGRTVLSADKSALTGWGAGLPAFHAGKYRPFVGTVFFVSPNPEALPWTTTKSNINEESSVWQEARIHMVTVGRTLTRFLDSRYTSEGTAFSPSDLRDATGAKISVLDAAVASERSFEPPTRVAPRTTKIQYEAKVSDIKKIEDHTKRKMGGSAVGRYTFDYYLKNEVGVDE